MDSSYNKAPLSSFEKEPLTGSKLGGRGGGDPLTDVWRNERNSWEILLSSSHVIPIVSLVASSSQSVPFPLPYPGSTISFRGVPHFSQGYTISSRGVPYLLEA
jgi:hypothetical protein